MDIPDYISESLETIFGLKYLNSLMRIYFTLDPGFGMEKFGSGINVPDPQHCVLGTDTVTNYHL
jgi:hypothetical protein